MRKGKTWMNGKMRSNTWFLVARFVDLEKQKSHNTERGPRRSNLLPRRPRRGVLGIQNASAGATNEGMRKNPLNVHWDTRGNQILKRERSQGLEFQCNHDPQPTHTLRVKNPTGGSFGHGTPKERSQRVGMRV
jgi:hypothetical protein